METLLKVHEVAEIAQVSTATIYRYVAKKEIPYHKLIRMLRFRPSEIAAWLEERKANSNEQITMNSEQMSSEK